jgi:hypothetical protein
VGLQKVIERYDRVEEFNQTLYEKQNTFSAHFVEQFG